MTSIIGVICAIVVTFDVTAMVKSIGKALECKQVRARVVHDAGADDVLGSFREFRGPDGKKSKRSRGNKVRKGAGEMIIRVVGDED